MRRVRSALFDASWLRSSPLAALPELVAFVWARRLWWLVPMLIALLLVGALVVLAGSSPLSPFVYSLF